MKVNIKKISEVTGFSPATVSNALNYKKGVNAETSAKIIKAARDLGYFDENRITRVKFVMYRRNGAVVDDTPFFPLMVTGVEQECRACGMEMMMYNLDRRDANYKEQVKWLQQDNTSAVILLGTELMDEPEDLELIRGMSGPLVVIDYWKEDMYFDAVLINNADSARMATEYLMGKGHREIGYLQGSLRIKPFRSRASGYYNTLRKAGLSLRKEYVVTLSPDMDGAYNDMKKFLQANPKLPTAYFADNDMIALGAMKALQEFGIQIPEDVSMVGFDDLSFSSIFTPQLTTLRVPKQEMGRMAVRRLRDMIQDGDGTKLKIQACTQFIERDSVRDLNEQIR